MNSKLEKQFFKLEQSRLQLMAELLLVDETELNRKPKAGTWSPLQVISHLIQAEEISFRYIEKRIKNSDELLFPGVTDRIKTFLVIHGLKFPLKFKAPLKVAVVPELLKFNVLDNDWKLVRTKMKLVLQTTPLHISNRAVYIHPVGGPMNLYNTMNFMLQHVKRHEKQIRRAINQNKNSN